VLEAPRKSVEGTLIALRAFPASGRAPDLSNVHVAEFIAREFADQAVADVNR
jgi:hypothetical protein